MYCLKLIDYKSARDILFDFSLLWHYKCSYNKKTSMTFTHVLCNTFCRDCAARAKLNVPTIVNVESKNLAAQVKLRYLMLLFYNHHSTFTLYITVIFYRTAIYQ